MLKIQLAEGEIHHGSTVQGRVTVTLERPTRCREITVRLRAKAEANSHTPRLGEHCVPLTYTDECQTVWRPDTGDTDTLQKGEHSFSFQFKLCPINPFPIMIVHVPIQHTLTARMKLGRSKSYSTDMRFEVKERTDIETAETEPQTAQKVKHLALNGGTISLSASIPRTGYSSGESVPHKVSINNNSSKTLRVFSSLLSYQTAHSSFPGAQSHPVPLILSSLVCSSCSRQINSREKSTFELSVTIPAQTIANFYQCYMLMVIVEVPWRSNMILTLPLLYKKDLNLLQTSAATAMGISPAAMGQMYQQAAQYLQNSGAVPPHIGASPFGGPAQNMIQPLPYSGMGMPHLLPTSGMGMGPIKSDRTEVDHQPSTTRSEILGSQEDPPPYNMAVKN